MNEFARLLCQTGSAKETSCCNFLVDFNELDITTKLEQIDASSFSEQSSSLSSSAQSSSSNSSVPEEPLSGAAVYENDCEACRGWDCVWNARPTELIEAVNYILTTGSKLDSTKVITISSEGLVMEPGFEVDPVYPAEVQAEGIEGDITLIHDIDASGSPVRIQVLAHSDSVFVESVLNALSSFILYATEVEEEESTGEEPVGFTTIIQFRFPDQDTSSSSADTSSANSSSTSSSSVSSDASSSTSSMGSTSNIRVVDYLMQEHGVEGFVLEGTDYVFPRTVLKILEAYLISKGVSSDDISINYTPFGHSNWGFRITEIEQLGSADKKAAIISAVSGDAKVPFYRYYTNTGLSATELPVVSLSLSESELASLPSELFVGQFMAWNYFSSFETEPNRVFIDNGQIFIAA